MTRLGARNVPMVVFIRQTPLSPVVNANDLALYRHLGSVVAEYDYRTAGELVAAIMAAWQQCPEALHERGFATKGIVFAEIFCQGGKSIKIPHVGLYPAQAAAKLWAFVGEYMA